LTENDYETSFSQWANRKKKSMQKQIIATSAPLLDLLLTPKKSNYNLGLIIVLASLQPVYICLLESCISRNKPAPVNGCSTT